MFETMTVDGERVLCDHRGCDRYIERIVEASWAIETPGEGSPREYARRWHWTRDKELNDYCPEHGIAMK